MRLADLDAALIKRTETGFREVPTVAEADGVVMLCPVCFAKNGTAVGTHSVICWSPSVPLDVPPAPGRWNLVGTSINDLSLVAGSSSVWLTEAKCKAHFFVINGKIVNS